MTNKRRTNSHGKKDWGHLQPTRCRLYPLPRLSRNLSLET
ncbi:hypothetical protein J0S82_018547 [Galemys pyrenaicus]|uniref:Uncharacterized protein n=1 Tax=Galemys pyrenaicus TaxID=202257 RepID=A0A8J6AMC7_GALPY|nr:hypothetical protein J0S82_018547 [Galemys pyrenaicus]